MMETADDETAMALKGKSEIYVVAMTPAAKGKAIPARSLSTLI